MENHKYRIVRGEDFDITFLPRVMEIDKICYEDEYVGDLRHMEARYLRNPRTFVCVMDEEADRLAGYINFFPVKPALWNEIVEEGMDIRDDDILPEEMADYSATEPNRLFIISVAIRPEYRCVHGQVSETSVVRILTDGFIDYLNQLESEGFRIDAISATAVSEDGQKFLRNRMFRLYREIHNDNKVYLCANEDGEDRKYLDKLKKNDLYFKTYHNDMYMFLPYADNVNNKWINKILHPAEPEDADSNASATSEAVSHGQTPKSVPEDITALLDALDDCLRYEYQSDIIEELSRVYLGDVLLLHTLDSYPDENDDSEKPYIVGEEKAYLSLLAHQASHMYVLMLFIPDCKYPSSQLEDQLHHGYMKIRLSAEDKDEKGFYQYRDLNEYLWEEYRLLPCGRGKSILCMSKKPSDEREFYNILSAEAYNSMHQDFHIQYEGLTEQARTNKAIYDYYEVYMTEDVVAFILYDYDKQEIRERLELTATYVFIAEMVIFQNTALNKMTIKVSNALAHEGDVSYEYISQLYRDYAKTIKFWQNNNFKYYGTRKEAEQIRKAFENDELRSTYYEQQEFLEHIVDLKDAQQERKNGMIINVAATVLAVIQVQEYLVRLLTKIYGKFDILLESADSTFDTIVMGGGILAFLVWLILSKKEKSTQKKRLHRRLTEKQHDKEISR